MLASFDFVRSQDLTQALPAGDEVVELLFSGLDSDNIDLSVLQFFQHRAIVYSEGAENGAGLRGGGLSGLGLLGGPCTGDDGLELRDVLRNVHVVARRDVLEHALEHVRRLKQGIGHPARGGDFARADQVQDILQPVGELADVHEVEELGRTLDGMCRSEDPVDHLRIHVFHFGFDLYEVFFDVCDVFSRFGYELLDQLVKLAHRVLPPEDYSLLLHRQEACGYFKGC
ncbi:MAG: hypothetical protein BWZ01_02592 [Deltaproteobacteria bacterium ADurb.BinA179]|nr:MAG: hypothetical protein BWZ01_02592 [Deltaproteobacteria bacterium ADurb.BinA179]